MTTPAETEIHHRTIETNGIRMHLAEAGAGPIVLLCHGFPESWYSWRHQLHALAGAGYHAVAPDMRGYGQTDHPASPTQYTMLHHAGDMVGVLDALGVGTAAIVGHDWGAPVAWNTALLRPDRFTAVVGLSVPYSPRGKAGTVANMRRALPPDADFYFLYFQTPGVAEAELEADPRATLRRFLYSASGDPLPNERWRPEMRAGQGFLENTVDPKELPPWLSETDLDVYAAEFARTGFAGGLNWYRAADLTWELMAPFASAKLLTPALYVAGERDAVLAFPGMDQVVHNLQQTVPNLRKTALLPGCGHWTQQERPAEVNAEIIAFLQGEAQRA